MATNRTFTKRIKDINDNKNKTDKTDTMDDNNNDPTNNSDKVENSLFNKTLFIEGCDCGCLLYTSPSPRDKRQSRMPSSA